MPISVSEYRALAGFRYQIRSFLEFSEKASLGAGLEPQQHQFLLALKGLESGAEPTVGAVAARLLIRHHSAVGLCDRLQVRGLLRRVPGRQDRRRVLLRMTPRGERLLGRLSHEHRAELRTTGPALVRALQALVGGRR
jgi:DNA-binding MarR family transcriptional regulator